MAQHAPQSRTAIPKKETIFFFKMRVHFPSRFAFPQTMARLRIRDRGAPPSRAVRAVNVSLFVVMLLVLGFASTSVVVVNALDLAHFGRDWDFCSTGCGTSQVGAATPGNADYTARSFGVGVFFPGIFRCAVGERSLALLQLQRHAKLLILSF